MSAPLSFTYDQASDIMTIEGIRYTGAFFRFVGNNGVAVGTVLQILNREDGVVTLKTISQPEHKVGGLGS